MALTPEEIATIQSQITGLRSAIASGASKVVYHSGITRREIEYRSIADMRDALAELQQMLTEQPRWNRRTVGVYSSGF